MMGGDGVHYFLPFFFALFLSSSAFLFGAAPPALTVKNPSNLPCCFWLNDFCSFSQPFLTLSSEKPLS